MANRLPTAAALTVAWCACAPAQHARLGRIDIYVADKAFDLGQRTASPGAQVSNCSWLGEGKENAGASAQIILNARAAWQELWVEFEALGTGDVDIDLQGEYYRKTSADDIRLVWADNVSVQGKGAEIVNPSFEETGDDGRPLGWHFTGTFPAERYSRDGSVARFGDACIASWHGSQARQAFRVTQGERYRVTAWFRVFAIDPEQVRLAERAGALSPHFDFYTQVLEIELADEAAARNADVRVLPLLNGAEWAISSRWDDNNLSDLRMRDTLTAHGHKGNFYLNATSRGFSGDPYAYGQKPGANIGRELLRGGHAVGAHSWTHPMLSYCSRNRIFEEVMRCRIDWEAHIDSPVNSYAFSFCNYQNGLHGTVVQLDIAEALLRAGLHHVANGRFLQDIDLRLPVSWILPPDGRPIDAVFTRYLEDPGIKTSNPNISFDMHVWYRTPEAWSQFEKELDRYGGKPEWWYCNQNEYSAYRHQFERTRVQARREGACLSVQLARPCLRDLNDAVPITLEICGVPAASVRSVRAPRARCERTSGGESARINLWHDGSQTLPATIGWVRNDQNHPALTETEPDADLPTLNGVLHCAGESLTLQLRNSGEEPLENLWITYRLPLAWTAGVVRRRVPTVAPGATLRDTLDLKPATDDFGYRSGVNFCVAQVDFSREGAGVRLYLSCRSIGALDDATYPRDGFLTLGPIPESQLDEAEAVAAANGPGPLRLADARRLEWRRVDPSKSGMLDVEVVPTTCDWGHGDKEADVYLLRTTLHSEREQPARLIIDRATTVAVYLAGRKADAAAVTLREGENPLLLVCKAHGRFRPGNAGAFLRTTAPGSRDRLTDIRYVAQ